MTSYSLLDQQLTESSLWLAAKEGNLGKCERECNEKNINQKSKDATPLYIAAQGGRTYVVEFLINRGAFVETTFNGFTALYVACRNGHDKVAKCLLRCRG